MLIEPREIAPDFKKRWGKETLEILRRASDLWLGLAIAFAGLDFVLFPIFGFGMAIVGMFQAFVVFHLAQVVADRRAGLADLRAAWRHAGPRTLACAKGVSRIACGISLVSVAIHLIQLHAAGRTMLGELEQFDFASWSSWLVASQSPLGCEGYAAAWLYACGGTFFLGLATNHGLSERRLIHSLSFRAYRKNPAATSFLVQGSLVVLIIGYFVPPLGPVVMLVYPIFCFVVYRDFFEHGNGNKRLATVAREIAVALPQAT
ncbi:hypothetical protein F6X40_27560 [Paraburkholderia sp. UCT31]|uniref:hypothetical protein n=1 Tax=Paraburkholderia sp. UCT31 TaxID=2615209 RepID=UPI0016555C96|nr:hypothetical protein [Paraburkholderia sp. UCT31]MBC8740418.1 hypothetical protein [Paraburkholderia sp. UCT31]